MLLRFMEKCIFIPISSPEIYQDNSWHCTESLTKQSSELWSSRKQKKWKRSLGSFGNSGTKLKTYSQPSFSIFNTYDQDQIFFQRVWLTPLLRHNKDQAYRIRQPKSSLFFLSQPCRFLIVFQSCNVGRLFKTSQIFAKSSCRKIHVISMRCSPSGFQ